MADAAAPAALPVEGYLAEVRRRRLWSGALLLLFVLVMAGGFLTVNDRSAGGFLAGLPQILDFPRGLVTEAWENRARIPALLWDAVPALVETVNIAAVATLAGAAAGAALALLGTRGLAPVPWAVGPVRRLTDVLRAIPDVVIALVLIFVLGGGPVPALIAIAVHTAGAMGKLFSEVAEAADLRPVEGLASTGATWGSRMALAVLPQVAPNWLSYALLRLEVNIRASAILGFVGAGGIGYELRNAMTFGTGKFDEAAAIFLLLFATIVAVDQVSDRLRHRLVAGAPA